VAKNEQANKDNTACCYPHSINCKIPEAELKRNAKVFKAIGNKTRLEILSAIANYNNNVCACDFEQLFDIKQPTISHHIKILVEAGLVNKRKEGTWNYYSVQPDTVQQLIGDLKTLIE